MEKPVVPAELIHQLPPEGVRYVTGLYEQVTHPQENQTIEIGTNFLGSAQLSEHHRREKMGAVDYRVAVAGKSEYLAAAHDTHVVITDMDAGLGTSLLRDVEIAGIPHLNGRGLGSKGMDVHFYPPDIPRPVSVMEGKTLGYNYQAFENRYKKTTIEPLINFESRNAYDQFLSMEIAARRRGINPTTYKELLNDPTYHISLATPLMQPNLPTIDTSTGKLTNERTAPGGHGYLASILLDRLTHNPPSETNRVRVISNGDGINNTASPEMVGFAVRERAGIVMVTTTRTAADVKGGILGIHTTPEGEYVDIMELAQAQGVQKDIFQVLGIETTPAIAALKREHYPHEQYFNTNLALLNEGLLGTFLHELVQRLSPEEAKEFARVLAPDLIKNVKKHNGKEFIQLEGAMGSVLLKLNKYVTTNKKARELWADISGGSTFLRILNLDKDIRDEHFTPEKNAWDAYLHTSSDRYTLNTTTWRLRNNRPGHSISVNPEFLASPYYKQLHNMRAAFAGTSILGLDELDIQGPHPVLLPNFILRGRVHIVNNFGRPVNLRELKYHLQPASDGRVILENVRISIDDKGNVELTSL